MHNVYHTVLLKDLGCSSNAARIAELYLTDDRVFKHDFKRIDGSLRQTLAFVFTQTGRGKSPPRRMAAIINILLNGPRIARDLIETRCTRGAAVARRLRLSEDIANAIAHLDEHWDGSGKPWAIAGHAIPIASRIALLAQVVDVHFTAGGPQAARTEIAKRAGNWIDPTLSQAFLALSVYPQFWKTLGSEKIRNHVLALEPRGAMLVDDDYLDDIAAAFGQVSDAKSPFTDGRSGRMAYYCTAVADKISYPPAYRRDLNRAALLHDIGKLGISSEIIEKSAPLNADEWAILQGHAALSAQILDRVPTFAAPAEIVAAHHERLDGTGYPLGLTDDRIAPATRIVTVCDIFDALTTERPHRPAFGIEEALKIMDAEAGSAVDPACLKALKHVVAQGMPDRPQPNLCR